MEKVVNKLVGIVLVLFCIGKYYLKSFGDTRDKIVYVVFWPRSLPDLIDYLFRGYLIQDYVLLKALDESGYKAKVVRWRGLDRIPKNSVVCYSMTKSTTLIKVDSRISQGESLYLELTTKKDFRFFPNPIESRMWENKEFMHKVFEEKNIPTPVTEIVNSVEALSYLEIKFPVLTKSPNLNQSKGIDVHFNAKSLTNAVERKLLQSKVVIIQELLDISFDIRVVVISGKVVYHYWRHKVSSLDDDSFSSTSTVNGGLIDIDELPLDIIEESLIAARKLGLSLAAFDVTYVLKKGKKEVVFFEVSPSFILNPIPKLESDRNRPYVRYKAKYWRFNVELINQFIEIKKIQIKAWNISKYLTN